MPRASFVVLVLLVACQSSDVEEEGQLCGAGASCPMGQVCNPVTNRCVRGSLGRDAAIDASSADARVLDAGLGDAPMSPQDGPSPPDASSPPDAPPPDEADPDTTITGKPSAISGPDVTFIFEASEAATFECRLDGEAFAPCTSPRAYTGLGATPDPHLFSVRAIDLAGNVDATPASHSWTVDPSALDTSITMTPPALSGPDVGFAFTATRPGSFECRLAPLESEFTTCASPRTVTGLDDGAHTFAVRAAVVPTGAAISTSGGVASTVQL